MKLKVVDNGKGKAVYTKEFIKNGSKVVEYGAKYHCTMYDALGTNYSLQIGMNEFVDINERTLGSFINHSCNPNLMMRYPKDKMDFKGYYFIAARDIEAGEELTYDYNTTEYDSEVWGCGFKCLCGSENCIGNFRGFKFLNGTQRNQISHLLAPYLRRLL